MLPYTCTSFWPWGCLALSRRPVPHTNPSLSTCRFCSLASIPTVRDSVGCEASPCGAPPAAPQARCSFALTPPTKAPRPASTHPRHPSPSNPAPGAKGACAPVPAAGALPGRVILLFGSSFLFMTNTVDLRFSQKAVPTSAPREAR